MNLIRDELKLFGFAFLTGLIGMQIGFHLSETLGMVIVVICILIAAYAVIKGQLKFFGKLRSRRDRKSDA